MKSSNCGDLTDLGISIWRKRSKENNSFQEQEIYLIDTHSIIIFGKKDKNISYQDKEYFLKTLAKSIRKEEAMRLKDIEKLSALRNIFLLDADLPDSLKDFEDLNLYSLRSMSEICNSEDSKKSFLTSINEIVR
jgi:hypothetical protein